MGRLLIAASIGLGNDEAYYVTYAMFPDWSHFDHPPMVGWLIQFTTLNLTLYSELFIRLGAILLGAGSSWIIFRLGTLIKDEHTGLITLILYTASFYSSIISGTFILPDSPQIFFWLASLYFLLKALPEPSSAAKSRNIYLAGLFIGLAMLSKYTAVFLWLGAGLYILFFRRMWLSKSEFYISVLISFLLFLPVIIWNYNNDFVSFAFHGGRVGAANFHIRPDYFFTELSGEILYNNPLVFIMIISAIIALIRKRKFLYREHIRIMISICLPLILFFLTVALFRRTLPHWTGPAYTTLILLAAAWERKRIARQGSIFAFRGLTFPALLLTVFLLVPAAGEINRGWLDPLFKRGPVEADRLGRGDVTLDMYGWEQIGEKFAEVKRKAEADGVITVDAPIISWRWFPAANIDYYVARPLGLQVFALGSLGDIHKYEWINKLRGGLRPGTDAWFICTSRDFHDPSEMCGRYFRETAILDTIPVYRGKTHVMNAFIYKVKLSCGTI